MSPRFQDLPRRARDIIYRELFIKPKVINIPEVVKKSRSTVAVAKSLSGLALLRTNKRIHQECLEVLYGENKFVLEALGLKPERISMLEKIFKIIGTRGRRHLKYLSLRLHHYRLRGRLSNKSRKFAIILAYGCHGN